MTLPTSSIKVDLKKRIYDLLTANTDLLSADVYYAEPRAGITSSCVFLGAVTGQSGIPTMTSGRKRRRESFTVQLWVAAVVEGDADGIETDEAYADLFAEVQDLFADKPTLAVDGDGLPGLMHCWIAEEDGPQPFTTETGRGTYSIVSLFCQSQLT